MRAGPCRGVSWRPGLLPPRPAGGSAQPRRLEAVELPGCVLAPVLQQMAPHGYFGDSRFPVQYRSRRSFRLPTGLCSVLSIHDRMVCLSVADHSMCYYDARPKDIKKGCHRRQRLFTTPAAVGPRGGGARRMPCSIQAAACCLEGALPPDRQVCDMCMPADRWLPHRSPLRQVERPRLQGTHPLPIRWVGGQQRRHKPVQPAALAKHLASADEPAVHACAAWRSMAPGSACAWGGVIASAALLPAQCICTTRVLHNLRFAFLHAPACLPPSRSKPARATPVCPHTPTAAHLRRA